MPYKKHACGKLAQGLMTGRKVLSPSWLAPQSDHGSAACAETEAFFQYGPPQSFFELSWLALQKARAREVGATMMTGRKFLSPSLLWLAPQSDHGSAARAETEAFFQSGPPQSFFELSWLALQKARQGANFCAASSYGSLRSPITGVPHTRHPTKSTRAGSWRKDDEAQISKPPPLGARSAIRSRECRVRGN